ncbi:MAG: DUF2267 domain-containing protein [Burkholderiales bacterium]|nr:DUF2267 domain-containing protein [Burkholderiales bacterium]
MSRDSIVADLAQRLGMDERSAAEALLAVGAAVAETVTDGQMEDVRGQLPPDLRAAFVLPRPLND